jgi:hypothetical protein
MGVPLFSPEMEKVCGGRKLLRVLIAGRLPQQGISSLHGLGAEGQVFGRVESAAGGSLMEAISKAIPVLVQTHEPDSGSSSLSDRRCTLTSTTQSRLSHFKPGRQQIRRHPQPRRFDTR